MKLKHQLLQIILVCINLNVAAADEFPSKPIRMIVPYTAGGATDTLARSVAEKLSVELGQRVYVDNKPGASGVIAAKAITESEKDGYTLLFSDSSIFVIIPHFKKDSGIDPIKDFAPIALIARQIPVLVARESLPANSLAELLTIAREKPDSLTYGSFGIGTWSHVAMEGLQQQTGVKLVHVPYRGSAQVITDAVGGRIDVFLNTLGSVIQYQDTKKLKVIGVGTPQRAYELPNVPAIAELVPSFAIDVWFGLVAPAGTPEVILKKIADGIDRIGKDAGYQEALRKQELKAATERLDDLGKAIATGSARWGAIVEKAGLRE